MNDCEHLCNVDTSNTCVYYTYLHMPTVLNLLLRDCQTYTVSEQSIRKTPKYDNFHHFPVFFMHFSSISVNFPQKYQRNHQNLRYFRNCKALTPLPTFESIQLHVRNCLLGHWLHSNERESNMASFTS